MVPDPVTSGLLTSIVSIDTSLEAILIVILPLPTTTFSLKFKTMVPSFMTFVALSAGVDELRVGDALSNAELVVKVKAVVEVIPA